MDIQLSTDHSFCTGATCSGLASTTGAISSGVACFGWGMNEQIGHYMVCTTLNIGVLLNINLGVHY